MNILHTALLVIVFFTVIVWFHELGHFLAAKMFRMRVIEFAIGFWKRVVRVAFDGETEYNIRALPLGGFVRIAGMEIEDAAEAKLSGASLENTNTALLEQETAEVADIDPNGFNSRPLYQRFIVILAGPVFSFLLGWLVLCSVGMTIGFPAKALFLVDDVTPKSRAADAGLHGGDTILTIDGKTVDFDGAMHAINQSIEKPLTFNVRDENGAERSVTVTPKSDQQPGETKPVGRIGVVPDESPQSYERLSPGASIARGTQMFGSWFQIFYQLTRSGEIKNNVGGPVSIVRQVNTVAKRSVFEQVVMLAELSMSIGLANLLPIPIFDGGHLALMLVELVRRRKLTAEQTGVVFTVGLGIIAVLVVVVLYLDISKIFHHR